MASNDLMDFSIFETSRETIAVVGGGLVGSMAACVLAKRGYEVHMYEMREDIRKLQLVKGKSINLALSERGRSALRILGLEEKMIQLYGIPMKGRLIHQLDGRKRPIPYGREDECIYSISRRALNEVLLDMAEEMKISISFGHKLVSCNLDECELELFDSKKEQTVRTKVSAIIGCDGAHSRLRTEIMRKSRFNYSQEYIDHGYLELNIPANEDGTHKMEVNYLHIWPRGTFMMIALPNKDGSFTVTLFMPFKNFESIKTPEQLIKFFQERFSDSLHLIGGNNLVETFFRSGPSSLISIKCQPYNYVNKILLIGDSAHAMVPFYGQGMNCGFEDVTILNEILSEHDIHQAILKFSDLRVADGHAICDLALYNYIEMRDLVNSRSYLLRKKLDNFMSHFLPNSWVPLYSMVTFSRIPYSQCVRKRRHQDQIIKCTTLVVVVPLGFAFIGHLVRNRSHSLNALFGGAHFFAILRNFSSKVLSALRA